MSADAVGARRRIAAEQRGQRGRDVDEPAHAIDEAVGAHALARDHERRAGLDHAERAVLADVAALVFPVVGGGVHDAHVGRRGMVEQLRDLLERERVRVVRAVGERVWPLGGEAGEPVGRLIGERVLAPHRDDLEAGAVAPEPDAAVARRRFEHVAARVTTAPCRRWRRARDRAARRGGASGQPTDTTTLPVVPRAPRSDERGGHVGERNLREHERVDRRPARAAATSADASAREQGGVARDRAAEVHADHAVVLDQHVVGGHVGHPAAREPDHEDPPAPRDAATRAVEHVTADRVVDDVGTVAVGVLLHAGDEVVGAVVDRELGAELTAQRDLVVAARGRDHAGARGARRAGSRRSPRHPRPRAPAATRRRRWPPGRGGRTSRCRS